MRKIEVIKSLRLLVRPAVIAVLFLAFRYAIHKLFPSNPDIDSQWASAIIAGTYGLHALFAGFSINRISNKQDIIEQADAYGNQDDFMFWKEKRSLDTPWRILLLMQTSVLHVMFLFAPFPPLGLGQIFIAGGSLTVLVFWEVAVELDDPFSGIWNLHLYHPEWQNEKVTTHFDTKKYEQGARSHSL